MAREKASANELSAKLYTTEKDLSFKIKVGTYFQQKPRHRNVFYNDEYVNYCDADARGAAWPREAADNAGLLRPGLQDEERVREEAQVRVEGVEEEVQAGDRAHQEGVHQPPPEEGWP